MIQTHHEVAWRLGPRVRLSAITWPGTFPPAARKKKTPSLMTRG